MPARPDGTSFTRRIPPGDDRERWVCTRCEFIDYENPRIIVGCVATRDDKYLLVKRAIEPCVGKWALPAGFMEQGETPEAGAAREAFEEARAQLEIDALLAVYSIPRISHVQMFYRATLMDPEISAGAESLEVGLFAWEEIPWEELAFTTVGWALKHHREVEGQTAFQPRTLPVALSDMRHPDHPKET